MAAKSGVAIKRLGFFRTTAFKLSLVYIVVFTTFATFLAAYVNYDIQRIIRQNVTITVEKELDQLASNYRQGGIRRLVRTINRRDNRPGASLYLLASPSGSYVAGNIDVVATSVLAEADPNLRRIRYQRLDDEGNLAGSSALVRVFKLQRGFTLLVGRDVTEGERFTSIVRRSLILTVVLMIALGLISSLFVSRRVLKRVDAVADTSRQIMTGDLTGRLEVTGSGDEFDRLSINLNLMLDRIEQLMTGLKEVSDNIAHDLKTPLTRMRNRVEDTLASAHNEDEYRHAFQSTIEDADQLIRTFDALLMIARVEAGSSTAVFQDVDLSAVAQDVAELYEPVAEEDGVAFTLTIEGSDLAVSGSRELLSQAIANLIDNAIKYSTGTSDRPTVSVTVRRTDNHLMVDVADNGPGIEPDQCQHVKERFVRLEASRSRPGAGLGLSLVSAVARLHNGSLELLDNEPGLRAELVLPDLKKGHDRNHAG